MKTKSSFFNMVMTVGGAGTLLTCLPSGSWACHANLNPIAFQHPLSHESDLLPNGMMAIVYEHEQGEQMTHVTIHRIHMSMAEHHPRLPERRDPKYAVLQTDGTLSPMTYVIITNALIYGTGRDSLGFHTKTWIDSDEDGLNGNEQATFPHTQSEEQMIAQAPRSR